MPLQCTLGAFSTFKRPSGVVEPYIGQFFGGGYYIGSFGGYYYLAADKAVGEGIDTWNNASTFCTGLVLNGYSDWGLWPRNILSLAKLANGQATWPASQSWTTTATTDGNYWSSEQSGLYAYTIEFWPGGTYGFIFKTNNGVRYRAIRRQSTYP